MQEVFNDRILHLKPGGLLILTHDQRSNLRRICLTCLFPTSTRFDLEKPERRFSKKKYGFEWIWKKWKMKQRRKCFVFWSGRWESNPSPYTANLLNPFIASTRLGSIRVHNRGYFFDRCAMRIPYDMPVNLQRRPRIGVTKLTLYDFWC